MRVADFFDQELMKTALQPQALSGSSDVNGVEIDTQATGQKARLAQFFFALGAVTGSPSAVSVNFRLQHTATSGSGYADFADTDVVSSTGTALTAANTSNSINVELAGTKRYVRIVATPTFTGGTSPTALACASARIGDLRFI